MTDREILDALLNVRNLCIPGQNWTDDIARLVLAEFDWAVIEIEAVIKLGNALLAACQHERGELAADQAGSSSPPVRKHLGRRIARLDSALSFADDSQSTGDRSSP